MDSYQGKKLNSPNDVVVKSDGSVWFTDPIVRHPGLLRGREGRAGAAAVGVSHRRADRRSDHGDRRSGGAERPGVLARRIEPLHRRVARAAEPQDPGLRRGRRHEAGERPGVHRRRTWRLAGRIPRRYPRQSVVRLGHGRATNSTACGCSIRRRQPIGHISLPERCANVCFGGRWRNRLFMAASHSLYALYVNTQGAPGG